MIKFMFVLGTRPEAIKLAPVMLAMDREDYEIVNTGQHRDVREFLLSITS